MNFALQLSASRIVFALIILFCLSGTTLLCRAAALFFFILAAITDIWDGVWARKRNGITTGGILLDPLADKILVAGVFISFVGIEELSIPAWMVALIIIREISVMGLRLLALGEGKVIAAQKEGKQKTIFQMTAAILILIYLLIRTIASSSGLWNEKIELWGRGGIYFIMSITLIITLISGCRYFQRFFKKLG